MLVDGQIRWQETVKGFLLVTSIFSVKQEASIILSLGILRHVPRVIQSPSCVSIPADTSFVHTWNTCILFLCLFKPYSGFRVQLRFHFPRWTFPHRHCLKPSFTLCTLLDIGVQIHNLAHVFNPWLAIIFLCVHFSSLLLDYKHFMGWIDLQLTLLPSTLLSP